MKSGITEIDRLDLALARGSQQSAKRLASERDFAADASHQLRTPLTALLMRLEEIASTDDPEVVAEEANIAISQVERLSKVVDDLMSRTRSGVDTNPAVSLDSVLASLQREWQPAFAGARRSVKISGERGVQVRATPVALGQILTTLLENSLAYGRGTVEIAARRAGPSVVIEVTDEGDGVAAALAPHIFERLGVVVGQRPRALAGARPRRGRGRSPRAGPGHAAAVRAVPLRRVLTRAAARPAAATPRAEGPSGPWSRRHVPGLPFCHGTTHPDAGPRAGLAPRAARRRRDDPPRQHRRRRPRVLVPHPRRRRVAHPPRDARAERQPEVSLAMTVVGCLAGCVPTMWTLVVPLALLLLAVLRLMGPTGTTVTGPGPGDPVGP